jgi:hypothetical protein
LTKGKKFPEEIPFIIHREENSKRKESSKNNIRFKGKQRKAKKLRSNSSREKSH